MDVVDALDASEKPTILALQQKFPSELANKVGLAGGNMTAAMKSLGCLGVISNGPSRDIDEIRPMEFQYLLSGISPGHGAMAVQSVNVPVSIAGWTCHRARLSTWTKTAHASFQAISWKRC